MVTKKVMVAFCLVILSVFSFCVETDAFSIANQSSVGEIAFSGAGDGNGNFLVGIARTPDNGPVTAVLFDSSGNIVENIDTGRIGCCTAVAFDGANYLLIWEDSDGNIEHNYYNQQVYGMFISTDGNPVGEPFPISDKEIMLDGVSYLAFGSGSGASRYLVIYTKKAEDDYDSGPLLARFVGIDGTVSEEFQISDNHGGFSSVAYDYNTSKFFVVWVDESADYPNVVKGRFIDLNGFMGNVLTIRQGPSQNAYPNDNPTNVSCAEGKCLVAYTVQQTANPMTYDPNKWYLYGNFVDATDESVGPQIPIVTRRSQVVPTIGFDGEKWLVAYNDYANDTSNFGICNSTEGTCWNIMARYVSTEGTLIGNPFVVSAGAGMELGGIGGYDSSVGFLALINKCGNSVFSSKCDVYGSFISTSQSYIGLLSPKSGESVSAGSMYQIRWTASSDIQSVTLKLSMNNGMTWTNIASNVTGTTYNWTVPKPSNNKTKCLISITAYDSNNVVVVSDKTDGTFTIEVVRLVLPNEDEILYSRNSYDITWTTNETNKPVAKVVLSYTLNGGVTWKPIYTYTGGDNPGTHSWTVPTVNGTKTKCRVRIVLKDSAGNTVGTDVSDGYFTISP